MKEMFRMVDKSKVDEVKQMLEYTQKGTAKATVGNYMVVLRNDPLVRESMKYNKLTGRIDIVKKLWWNEEVCKLDDDGRTYFYYFFERYYKLTSEKCMDKALRMKIMSVVITVIVYGRMIEIYLYTSLAPIPFATMSNREWGHVGTNYFRGLFALAFQAFLMMVCVAIYAALISSVRISSNMHSALIGVAAYTVILCFSLMKTGSLSKQIFGSH